MEEFDNEFDKDGFRTCHSTRELCICKKDIKMPGYYDFLKGEEYYFDPNPYCYDAGGGEWYCTYVVFFNNRDGHYHISLNTSGMYYFFDYFVIKKDLRKLKLQKLNEL
jgi:hypothetical protein